MFEQSGTFKNEFKKLGVEAFDYDIQNEFNQTDYVIDLFEEIRKGYENEPSIFDNFKPEDVILAFFPCTRFETQITLWFRGCALQQKNMSDIQNLESDIKLHKELHLYYTRLCQLCVVVLKRGLRMVFENPYTQPHYLTTYWCLKPKVIDKNRRLNGDYQNKPTQYWFVGFEPQDNLIFEPIEYVEYRTHNGARKVDGKSRETMRSMIHPQYANRFIRQYIIDGERLDVYGKIKNQTSDK